MCKVLPDYAFTLFSIDAFDINKAIHYYLIIIKKNYANGTGNVSDW